MTSRRGMTLIELMVTMALLSVVLATLFGLGQSMGLAVRNQTARTLTADQARLGIQAVIRELRQAARQSIDWGAMPTSTISYRVATDLDGNGVAVDQSGNLELSGVRTIGPDTDDLNGDGLTNQLIWSDGTTTRVLANNLSPNEDTDGDGVLGSGEDQNGNGLLDSGIVFAQQGDGIFVAIQTEHVEGVQAHRMYTRLVDMVVPRNN